MLVAITSTQWGALLVLGLFVLASVWFLGDFLRVAIGWILYARFSTEKPEPGWFRATTADAWTLNLYKWKRTPRIRVSGAMPVLEDLFNGRMLAAVAAWWNELLRQRPALERQGMERIDEPGLAAIRAKIEPDNRATFKIRAYDLAPVTDLREGALAISYCFARVFAYGTASDGQEAPYHVDMVQLVENDQRYDKSILASELEDVPSEGWWRENELRSLWNRVIIDAIRWSYRDQIRRWEAAVGSEMGSGVGFAPLEELGPFVQRFDELLFEHGGRFFQTERNEEAWERE